MIEKRTGTYNYGFLPNDTLEKAQLIGLEDDVFFNLAWNEKVSQDENFLIDICLSKWLGVIDVTYTSTPPCKGIARKEVDMLMDIKGLARMLLTDVAFESLNVGFSIHSDCIYRTMLDHEDHNGCKNNMKTLQPVFPISYKKPKTGEYDFYYRGVSVQWNRKFYLIVPMLPHVLHSYLT